MRAAVVVNRSKAGGPSGHVLAFEQGLRRHGVRIVERGDRSAHFSVCWSWRTGLKLRSQGVRTPILVMERGYIGDRFKWTSLGWDGLNGHARFNGVWDDSRFERHFAADLKPWRENSKGYALIMGQVMGDTSLVNVDILRWYRETAAALWNGGWEVRYRQHPMSIRKRQAGKKGHDLPQIPFATLSEDSLDDALDGAALVVAWNSNSLVDAVMAGVPVYAGDKGSMVYDLASRDFNPIYPPREKRLNEIANVQWQMSELADGSAWEVVKTAM